MDAGTDTRRRHATSPAALSGIERAIRQVMGVATPLAVSTGLLAPVTLAPGMLGGIAALTLGDDGNRGTRSWYVNGALHGVLDATIRPGGLAFTSATRVVPGLVAPSVPELGAVPVGNGLLAMRSRLQRVGFALGAVLCAIEAANVVVANHTATALVTTTTGRHALLGALGSALAISPHPVAQLASAACMVAALLA